MSKPAARFLNYLRSDKFYRLILLLFIFEASWIAVSAAYPQAFDENFHFGLIKVYSHHWLPFLSSQPPGADAYGAVARDPSYLYHYLMSFPYRLIALVTKDQMAQIIMLRFINVALFAWGITLFRKVLLKVGSSKALTNLILMLFILIPVVPQLAGQINYDNLMIPLVALALLLAFRITDEIRHKRASVYSLALLLGLCLLTCLVKYAFLPIFVAIVLYLAVLTYKTNRHAIKGFIAQLLASWQTQKRLAKVLLPLAVIIPLGLFAQRDIVNLVSYHAIEPNCSSVISVKECLHYSPWAYNYKNHAKVVAAGPKLNYSNPIVYGFQWIYWMWYRLFFAVNGLNSHFKNYPPLPLPSAAALIVLVAGSAALIKWWRKLFKGNLYLTLLLSVSVIYLLALIAEGYSTYRYTAVLENMNGRYLLPVLLLCAVIFGQALSYALAKAQNRKIIFAAIALLFFIEGGGVLTFIARSDPSWDVHSKAVVKVNNAARKVVKKVVVSGRRDYDTHLWFFN